MSWCVEWSEKLEFYELILDNELVYVDRVK